MSYQRTLELVAGDTDLEQKVLEVSSNKVITLSGPSTSVKQSIPVSTNSEIDLGGVSSSGVKLLYIEAEAAVSIRLGAADATPIPLTPPSTGIKATFLAELDGSTTQIWIENLSASALAPVLVFAAA